MHLNLPRQEENIFEKGTEEKSFSVKETHIRIGIVRETTAQIKYTGQEASRKPLTVWVFQTAIPQTFQADGFFCRSDTVKVCVVVLHLLHSLQVKGIHGFRRRRIVQPSSGVPTSEVKVTAYFQFDFWCGCLTVGGG